MKIEALSSQMIEYMPFGIYIIDKSYQISYYNQAFAKIFSPGVHPVSIYFGDLVQCKYCTHSGSPDLGKTQCSNCLIIRQHEAAFENKSPSQTQEVVQEFDIEGKKTLKYLQIQSIPLNDDQLMVILHDLTKEAQKLMEPSS